MLTFASLRPARVACALLVTLVAAACATNNAGEGFGAGSGGDTSESTTSSFMTSTSPTASSSEAVSSTASATASSASATSTASSSSASSSSQASTGSFTTASSTTTTTIASSSTGVSKKTCAEVTPSCSGDGTTPTSGCEECAILGDDTIATNGGACANSYVACFGTDASCTGGQQGCCNYSTCFTSCDTNGNGTIDAGAELACYCTVDPNDSSSCDAVQVDTSTCLGALYSDDAAFTAYTSAQACLFDAISGACEAPCGAVTEPQPTCEGITTTCTGDFMTPTSGCEECAVLGDTTIASNGGVCLSTYEACYGTDASCTGGQAGCCTYSSCVDACDTNKNGTIDQSELPCLCTVDAQNPNQCAATQTDTKTCLGALEANSAAFNAFEAFETCAFNATTGVCGKLCQ